MELKQWYESDIKKEIENRMLDSISKTDNKIIDILKYQISPSKRIRSYLLYVLCNNFLKENEFYHISTAIELFQQATLIFDDVIDDTYIRDGDRIALHNKLWNTITGAGKADHLASILMLLAEKELYENNDQNIVEEFIRIRLEMFKAQLVDTFVIEKPNDILYMDWLLHESYKKTTSFMEFPFFIYSKKLGFDKKNNDFVKVGKNLGILYQIGDDLFDIDDGVKSWTLCLTYPLWYLLDSKNILDNEEKTFLDYLLIKKKLHEEDAQKLTMLFRKHKEKIILSTKKYFEESYQEINVIFSDNVNVKNIIFSLLKSIINPKYRQYKV